VPSDRVAAELPLKVKPRLRGIFHEWAFYVAIPIGVLLGLFADTARGRVAAVRSVFAHVCVLAEPAVLRGRRFGNLVVVASDRELPVSGLSRRIAADPFPARLMEGATLDRFVAGCAPIVDATAEPSPVMPPEVFA